MIKYILVSILLILVILYEAWNQKKNREAEWYFQDFRNKVLAFLSELRTEPENTRRMLRKLSFDDVETNLKNELQLTGERFDIESRKEFGERNNSRISNLAGRMDGLDYALTIINESKPKSYQKSSEETDPTMPKKLQSIYYESVKRLMEEIKNEKEKLY